MQIHIADKLLILDRERRDALARMDYLAARSLRLEINIIIALSEYPGRG